MFNTQRILNTTTTQFMRKHKPKWMNPSVDVSESTSKKKDPIISSTISNIWQTVVQQMNESVIVSNLQGEIVFTNAQFCSLTHYSENELLGKNALDLLLEEEDRETAQQKFEELKINDRKVIRLKLQTALGEIKHIKVSASPIQEDDLLIGSLCIISDITDEILKSRKEKAVFEIARRSNFVIEDEHLIFVHIHEELKEVMNARNMYISLRDVGTNEIYFPYVEDEFMTPGAFKRRQMGSGLTELVMKRRETTLISSKEPKFSSFQSIGKSPESWLGAPITDGTVCIGAIVVSSYDDPYAYDETDIEFLDYVAHQISSILARIRSHNSLVKKSYELIQEKKVSLLNQSKLLSTRLNPHFIFNSLNSIQYYILDEDTEPALEFLTKFSTLMRMVLNNSEFEHISLEEELKFLNLYLELEKDRHHDKFDFSIQIDENLNLDDIVVPPMLIQPYLENTIIHGVGHLKSGGKIDINFELKDSNLYCIIRDNGVGREKAAELKRLKKSQFKSKSSAIEMDRMDILKEIDQPGYDLQIIDLKNKDGEVAGTKVVITIPC